MSDQELAGGWDRLTSFVMSAYGTEEFKPGHEVTWIAYRELEEELDQANGCLAMIRDQLTLYPCMHDNDDHSATPPMMYPEWIACIIARAVKDAIKGACRIEEERRWVGTESDDGLW